MLPFGSDPPVKETLSGFPRAFWWLWTSTLVNRLGSFVAGFLALYLTADRGYSASYAGLMVALYGVGGAVSSVISGVCADRIGRRPTLLFAQLATAVLTMALGLVTHPLAIAALACAAGAASSASRPVVQAMIADLVPAEDRGRAFALNYWAINIGFAVASASAGLIAAHGYVWLFVGESVATLGCALVVFGRLPETNPGPPPATDDPAAEQAAGLGGVLRNGRFMAVAGLSFLIVMIFHQSSTALPIAMNRDGLTASQYGLVISVNGLLIVALQIPVTRLIGRFDPARLLVLACLLCGYGFGLNAFAGSALGYALAVAVWTLAEVVHSPLNMDLVARLSPEHAKGRYQGVFNLFWATGTLTAPLVGGVMIDSLGPAALWGACAVVGTGAAVGYWALLRRPEPEPAAAAGAVVEEHL
ncbi:major facilitator superfamily MFS_1 [Actinobacteria bacterium OK074]|nr:major facilitator superfamily MFS_1 [Actinobacteria bacterium OK074]